MSEEPRRKRKWDSQGEDDSAFKKLASEDAFTPAEGQNGVPAATSAEAVASAAAAAAAIAAAKINAMLVAKGQAPAAAEADGSGASTGRSAESDESGTGSIHSSVPIKESKERDEFVADIDINDVKHRYVLTKGGVQTQIQRDTGADVTTRGQHYTDRSLATEKNPPLYLHVTALTQESLDLAVKKINELIEEAQNPAPLPPQRESIYPPPRSSGPPRHLGFHARVAIGIESERMFNVRAKIVGPQGQYVKHVQNETRTRVQLKGYGSGYLEADTGRESDEPLYINILGNTQEDVDAAERLCKDLVETVKGEYTRMKSRPPPPQEPYGHGRHYGGRSSHYNGGHHQSHYQGGQQHHYQQPPPSRHEYSYNQQYQSQPPPPPGVAAPSSNPPLPPGPPPPPSTEHVAAPASAPGTSAATVDLAAQGYTYDQYEAYNQYYYQQQYYQQYGQYYQQAYAQPGAEQTQSTGAEGSTAPAAGPVSVDPALAYYGYAYAPPPPPPAEASTEATAASGEAAGAPPPPPPPPPAESADTQPSS
ncbi:hypothetical protein BGZ68_001047 [Mortierella alpina]|nr:hypothetical protein BGZ68_001047 [Mortierella alpina]